MDNQPTLPARRLHAASVFEADPAAIPDAVPSSDRSAPPTAEPAAPTASSATFAGYRLLSLLGEGGMGQVYVVEPVTAPLPPGRYALKTLARFLESDEELVQRFEREIAISRSLQHPNVVRIVDDGTDPSGTRYLVMELLEGRTLQDITEQSAPMDVASALELIAAVLEGVHAVHEAGVIHRDLKPSNIFFTTDGTVKIMDFGISRKGGMKSLTETGSALGTPDFIAPEQLKDSKRVDRRADLFSIGLVLYQMLSRALPFDAPSLDKRLMRLLTNQGTPVTQHRPDLSPDVVQWMDRLLAFRPDDRFATALAARETLPLPGHGSDRTLQDRGAGKRGGVATE